MSACVLLRSLSCFSSAANTKLPKPYFFTSTKALNYSAMEARRNPLTTESHVSQDTPEINQNYPKPVSAPPPPISKDIELSRATEASSKSSVFTLSKYDVLYEDEWIMAVNKPKGIYCEAVLSSAPQIVIASSSTANEFHLANRLDRDTSGVMLITKSHKVASKLVKAFTEHKVHKSYIALCIGPSPKWKKITIRSGHGRSKHGAWRVYTALDVGRVLPGGSFVRDMETTFEVVSINGQKIESNVETETVTVVADGETELSCDENKNNDEVSVVVVKAFPRSGRTHQIRLHCQYLGIPIRGDVKYHGVCEWRGTSLEGHELHAERLWFDHPVTNDPIVIQAPLPYWTASVNHDINQT